MTGEACMCSPAVVTPDKISERHAARRFLGRDSSPVTGHSDVAELRANGYRVTCEMDGVSGKQLLSLAALHAVSVGECCDEPEEAGP